MVRCAGPWDWLWAWGLALGWVDGFPLGSFDASALGWAGRWAWAWAAGVALGWVGALAFASLGVLGDSPGIMALDWVGLP